MKTTVIISRHDPKARDLRPDEYLGMGWFARCRRTVATVPATTEVPAGWSVTNVPDEMAFAARCVEAEKRSKARRMGRSKTA